MNDMKRGFNTKKEALSRMNTLDRKMRNPPKRCYFENGLWYLTSANKKVNSLKNLVYHVIKDSYSKRREHFETKEQMEDDIRFRNFLIKQIELYEKRNSLRED